MKKSNLSLVHQVLEAREKSSGAPPLLLLLHGIGSNEDDLFGLTPYLDGRFFIVSARAPLMMGPDSFGWFNIEYMPQGLIADLDQAEQSRILLLQFIDELIRTYEVDRERVYLMGFSQGAMMSLSVALTNPNRVFGVVAMSGRLPSQVLARVPAPEALRGMPIFVAHGLYDPVIPIQYGRACRDELEKLEVALVYREYPMAHHVTLESLQDISRWLKDSLDTAGHEAPVNC